LKPWQGILNRDPVPALLAAGDGAIGYFVQRDLLDEDPGPIQQVWALPEVVSIVKKQRADGSWKYPGRHKTVYPDHHYPLMETWKQFRYLVDQYGFTREHEATEKAAEFLFSCQTEEGDIRGMIGNQYATYYTGAMLGLLIQAGYAKDPRVEKGMKWLLAMRQKDGGWIVPILLADCSWKETIRLTSEYAEPIPLNPEPPFSHNWTGMVLRAFAAHPRYRKSKAAVKAARLLKTRFFQPDIYSSYRDAGYWVKFQFPFWWNHLVAALDSISRIGLSLQDEDIRKAIAWLREHQGKDGLWKLSYAGKQRTRDNPKARNMKWWISLAVCRILKRFHEQDRVA
jgi:hypothetical protein